MLSTKAFVTLAIERAVLQQLTLVWRVPVIEHFRNDVNVMTFVVCTPCCKKLGIGKDIRYDPPSMDVMSKTSVQTLFASTVRDCLSESGMSKPMLGRVVLSSKSFPKRCTHVNLVPFANVYVSDGTPIAGRERSAVRFQNCLQLERWPLGSTG